MQFLFIEKNYSRSAAENTIETENVTSRRVRSIITWLMTINSYVTLAPSFTKDFSVKMVRMTQAKMQFFFLIQIWL